MITYLEKLSETEQHLMIDAIPMITVLIAGADGTIDEEEKEWAEKVTKYRAFTSNEMLNDFYKLVGAVYSEHLNRMIQDASSDVQERTQAISGELAKLNEVLAKLDPVYAYHYYSSLVSFAEHVATASGGVLGFFSVSKEEDKLIGLPMLNVVERPAILDEEEEQEEA